MDLNHLTVVEERLYAATEVKGKPFSLKSDKSNTTKLTYFLSKQSHGNS